MSMSKYADHSDMEFHTNPTPRTDALVMGTHYDQFNAIGKLTELCRRMERELAITIPALSECYEELPDDHHAALGAHAVLRRLGAI